MKDLLSVISIATSVLAYNKAADVEEAGGANATLTASLAEVTALVNQVAEILGTVENPPATPIVDQVATLVSNVATVVADVGTVAGRVDNVETTTGAHTTEIAALSQTVVDQAAIIADLQARLTFLESGTVVGVGKLKTIDLHTAFFTETLPHLEDGIMWPDMEVTGNGYDVHGFGFTHTPASGTGEFSGTLDVYQFTPGDPDAYTTQIASIPISMLADILTLGTCTPAMAEREIQGAPYTWYEFQTPVTLTAGQQLSMKLNATTYGGDPLIASLNVYAIGANRP